MKHERNLPIFLKPWHECVGICKRLRVHGSDIVITLSLADGKTLEMSFQRASVDGANVLRELRDEIINQKIGILKVDNRKNTILIRKIIAEAEIHQYRAGGENR